MKSKLENLIGQMIIAGFRGDTANEHSDIVKYIKKYKKLGHSKDMALRVYTTRLLGRNSELVLHGGGNTSVKTSIRDNNGKN